jgi:hypothetical protein
MFSVRNVGALRERRRQVEASRVGGAGKRAETPANSLSGAFPMKANETK